MVEVVLVGKNPPAKAGDLDTWAQSVSHEDSLEEGNPFQ